MKTIMTHAEPEKNLTCFTINGPVEAAELVETIRWFYEHAVTLNVLWDLTHADLSRISVPDVQQIAALSAEYADRRTDGKTAIVGADDLTFGLARMYEMNKESSNLPFQTETFRTIEDARHWISSD